MNDFHQGWICCQLGAREHYAVARALHRHQCLELLLTDSWVRPTNPLGKLKPSLRARFHADVTTANVYAPNLENIAFEMRARLAGLRDWPLMIARNAWFQKMAVARLSQAGPGGSRTLVAYSYAALEIFRFARTRGWRTVLGQIDPGPLEERIVAKLYEADPLHRGDWKAPPPQYWSNWREECVLADRIVVNSQWSHAALVEEGIPAAKIRIVPLAYDRGGSAGEFRRHYPSEFTFERPLRVLFLGLVNLRKGVGPMFEAIRKLSGEPVTFSFVGPVQLGIPPDLRENPQVHWVGAVNRQNTGRFYRDADLLLFPTFSDGFGITQLEAQAWKLPIIASKSCGEVVNNGKNGWLLSEISPDAIVEAIRFCMQNPSCLREASGKSRVSELFTLAGVGRAWLNIFE